MPREMGYMDSEMTKNKENCIINNHDYEGGYIQPGIVPEGEVGTVKYAPASPEYQPDWAYSTSHYLKMKNFSGGGDQFAGKGSM